MTTLSSKLSPSLTQRRLIGVLDPNLVLSPHGMPLAKHLGEVMELWLARELWHILDNISFWEQHPESMRIPDIQVLHDWQCARAEKDPASLNLFWLGDRLGESFLPPHTDSDLLQCWELLARSLDDRIEQQDSHKEILTLAVRDTVALAIALNSAVILTYQSPANAAINLPPPICINLEKWNIPCQAIAPTDPIGAIECKHFRHLIVEAGLAKLAWSGLHLVILHLVVPAASALYYNFHRFRDFSSPEIDYSNESPSLAIDLWEGARGFWYQI
jgi:hypothetical protein